MEYRIVRASAVSAALLLTLHLAHAAAPVAPKPGPSQKPKSSAPRILAGDYLKAHGDQDVAYDAKDKKFYSVAYAKTHGMHDKGGDPLTVKRLSALPPNAAMSHAMHGKMPAGK